MAGLSIKLYENEMRQLATLPVEQSGKILYALLCNELAYELPELDVAETVIFNLIKGQTERARELSEKRSQVRKSSGQTADKNGTNADKRQSNRQQRWNKRRHEYEYTYEYEYEYDYEHGITARLRGRRKACREGRKHLSAEKQKKRPKRIEAPKDPACRVCQYDQRGIRLARYETRRTGREAVRGDSGQLQGRKREEVRQRLPRHPELGGQTL